MMLYSKMSESENQESSNGVHDLDVRILSAGLAAANEEPSVQNAVQRLAGSAVILTTRPPAKSLARLKSSCIT